MTSGSMPVINTDPDPSPPPQKRPRGRPRSNQSGGERDRNAEKARRRDRELTGLSPPAGPNSAKQSPTGTPIGSPSPGVMTRSSLKSGPASGLRPRSASPKHKHNAGNAITAAFTLAMSSLSPQPHAPQSFHSYRREHICIQNPLNSLIAHQKNTCFRPMSRTLQEAAAGTRLVDSKPDHAQSSSSWE